MAKKREFDMYTFLVGKLRAATRHHPAFAEAKKRARVPVKVTYDPETNTLCAYTMDGALVYTDHPLKKAQNRERTMNRCATCGRLFFDYEFLKNNKGNIKKTKLVAIDHIIPVVDVIEGFVDWDRYIRRMFYMGVDGLQVLCNYPGVRDGVESCHHIKTAQEKAQSAAAKRIKVIMAEHSINWAAAEQIDKQLQSQVKPKRSRKAKA
jgi:uncharacterized protein GlcG (DUF336 family)